MFAPIPTDLILQLFNFIQRGCSVHSFVHMADNVILDLHLVKVSNRRPSIFNTGKGPTLAGSH